MLRTSRPLGHALRSLAGLTAMACSFAVLGLLPLAEATALGFTAPLLTAALAIPLLGERVSRRRWLALLLGLAGVLVIVRPGTATFSWGALLGVAGALFVALAMLSIRRLGGTERGLTVALYFQFACTLAGAVSLLFVRHPPGAADLVALVTIGLLGGLAQVLMTRAYMSGPVSWIAPFEYSAILWSALLGFLFWGELPGPALILGAVLVIGAGLMVMREARAD
ncbi:MAG: DMT family transporter [Geminicoccaceae bacterium]